ncbi:MAG: Na/Pi cotransporter family protein [Candidatus Puniceispirillum sp.]
MINLLGAAALLLWGMRMVRIGMSRALGKRLQKTVGKGMSNRYVGFASGVLVTMVLQSSMATGLIISSFASRGIVTTAAGLAIILGADVGTTIVAQILTFDISWLIPLLTLGGVILHFSSKNDARRQWGRAAIGLALMLMALGMISEFSTPMRDAPILQDIFRSLEHDFMLAIILMALITWLAHSSLAMVLLIISLQAGGVISIYMALILVIGANIGGTIPAIMANWAKGNKARRIPVTNAAFKLIGCLVILPFIDHITSFLALLSDDSARYVVNFHTLFNVIIAAGFLFFINPIARFVEKLLPEERMKKTKIAPQHLDYDNIDDPSMAIASATLETVRMGHMIDAMLLKSLAAIEKSDRKAVRAVMKMDNDVDRLHEAIKLYVTKVSRAPLGENDSRRITNILTFTTDLEHIGDITENLMELHGKKISAKLEFSPEGFAEIKAMHERVVNGLSMAIGVFISDDVKLANQLLTEKRIVRRMLQAGAKSHMERLREERPESISTSSLHMDILRDLKRIHSHIVAIAYPILEHAGKKPS